MCIFLINSSYLSHHFLVPWFFYFFQKEPELLSGNDVLWTFVNFAGEDHTNFQTLVAFLKMLSALVCEFLFYNLISGMLYHVYAMSDFGVLDVMFLSGFKSRRCCKGLWVTSGKRLPFCWVEHFVWLLNYIWREVQTVSCWNHATRVSGRGCKSTGCISGCSSKGFDLLLLYFSFLSLKLICFYGFIITVDSCK